MVDTLPLPAQPSEFAEALQEARTPNFCVYCAETIPHGDRYCSSACAVGEDGPYE